MRLSLAFVPCEAAQTYQQEELSSPLDRKERGTQYEAPLNSIMRRNKRKMERHALLPFLYSTTLTMRFLHEVVSYAGVLMG